MKRTCISAALACACLWPAPRAVADGGTVQLAQRTGDYQLTVMTDPSPLRAGLMDVSVMVQNADSGQIVGDGRLMVTLRRLDEPPLLFRSEATATAATNKLLRSAQFELPLPGKWQMEVELTETSRPAGVLVELAVAGNPPHWRSLGWILAPLVPIGLYVLGELFAANRGCRKNSAASSQVAISQ